MRLSHKLGKLVDPRVLRAMKPYWKSAYGNASSVHSEGCVAQNALHTARARIAEIVKVQARDVVFTGNGTEANNLALRGVVSKLVESGVAPSDIEIISTKLEHPSILRVLEVLEREGVVVVYVPVSTEGRIDEKVFAQLLSPQTRLVTCAYAQSEIGVVQEVKHLSRAVRIFRQSQKTEYPYMHIDASQAPLWLPLQMDSLGVDMMTLDAGKCGGPKGVGALIVRSNVSIAPLLFGGSQERELRAGTENVAFAVGMAEAIAIAQKGVKERASRVSKVRDYFFEKLSTAFPRFVVHGSRAHRIANNVNVTIPGIDGEYAVVWLDAHSISASTKSACSGNNGGSETVRILGGSDEEALGTMRFTLGEETTERDVDATVAVLKHFYTEITQKLDRINKKL